MCTAPFCEDSELLEIRIFKTIVDNDGLNLDEKFSPLKRHKLSGASTRTKKDATLSIKNCEDTSVDAISNVDFNKCISNTGLSKEIER